MLRFSFSSCRRSTLPTNRQRCAVVLGRSSNKLFFFILYIIAAKHITSFLLIVAWSPLFSFALCTFHYVHLFFLSIRRSSVLKWNSTREKKMVFLFICYFVRLTLNLHAKFENPFRFAKENTCNYFRFTVKSSIFTWWWISTWDSHWQISCFFRFFLLHEKYFCNLWRLHSLTNKSIGILKFWAVSLRLRF